jgi:hypothetical protein
VAPAVEPEHGPPTDHFLAQEPVLKETQVEHLQAVAVLAAVVVAQAVPAAQRVEQLVVPQETDYPAASQERQPSMPQVEPALEPVLEVQPDHQAVLQRSPMQQLALDQVVAVAAAGVHISRPATAAVALSLLVTQPQFQ